MTLIPWAILQILRLVSSDPQLIFKPLLLSAFWLFRTEIRLLALSWLPGRQVINVCV